MLCIIYIIFMCSTSWVQLQDCDRLTLCKFLQSIQTSIIYAHKFKREKHEYLYDSLVTCVVIMVTCCRILAAYDIHKNVFICIKIYIWIVLLFFLYILYLYSLVNYQCTPYTLQKCLLICCLYCKNQVT